MLAAVAVLLSRECSRCCKFGEYAAITEGFYMQKVNLNVMQIILEKAVL